MKSLPYLPHVHKHADLALYSYLIRYVSEFVVISLEPFCELLSFVVFFWWGHIILLKI